MVGCRLGLLGLLLAAACAPTGKKGEAPPVRRRSLPRSPELYQPESPSPTRTITVQGQATRGHRIELFVNSVGVRYTTVRADGRFEFRGIELRKGSNLITAIAEDAEGNRSDTRASGGGDRPNTGGVLRPEVRVIFDP